MSLKLKNRPKNKKETETLDNLPESTNEEANVPDEDGVLYHGSQIASSESMAYALMLIAGKFNLGDNFVMTSFTDKPNSCKITVANKDFEVTVNVYDKLANGFPYIAPKEEE